MLAESGKFIDWQKYRLGRLQSEMRTEYKKSALDSELVTVANIRVNPKKADPT